MENLKIHNPDIQTDLHFPYMECIVPGYENSKPSLGVIDENEMVLFTNHFHYEEKAHGGRQVFHSVMYRSHDGGQTFGEGQHTPFRGYEASVTVIDGFLFVQTHFFPTETSKNQNCIGILYRSEDNGETWTETEIDPDFLGLEDKKALICPTRNLIKLASGAIALFVWGENKFQGRILSWDMGKTWTFTPVYDDVETCTDRPILCESFTYLTPSGRLMAVTRIDPSAITDTRIPHFRQTEKYDTDQGDGLLLIESKDDGLHWHAVRGLGSRGMMYPSVVYTDDTHFILTYTQRVSRVDAPYPHSGVQAVFGTEEADGSFTVNFNQDLVILDDKTPDAALTADGYGITQILPNGHLITPYCFAVLTDWYRELLECGECYHTDDIFIDFTVRCGKGEPNLSWWHSATPEWKIVILWEMAMQLRYCHPQSRVIIWERKEN